MLSPLTSIMILSGLISLWHIPALWSLSRISIILIPNFMLSFSAILVVGWFIISNMLRVNFCKTMKNDPASTLSNLALDSSRIPWSWRVAKPFNWSYYSLIWIYNSLSFSGSFLSTFITYWLAFESQLVAL